jgi:hypothetical protein
MMATRIQALTRTIVAATIATFALASIARGAELHSTASETGATSELVNRADCWTDETANAWDRCLFR